VQSSRALRYSSDSYFIVLSFTVHRVTNLASVLTDALPIVREYKNISTSVDTVRMTRSELHISDTFSMSNDTFALAVWCLECVQYAFRKRSSDKQHV
jgi:hypothetical protein